MISLERAGPASAEKVMSSSAISLGPNSGWSYSVVQIVLVPVNCVIADYEKGYGQRLLQREVDCGSRLGRAQSPESIWAVAKSR